MRKIDQVAALLMQKHIPKGLFYEPVNWEWLENMDTEDIALLVSVRDEISKRIDAIYLKLDTGWFSILCRRISRDQRLKDLIFKGNEEILYSNIQSAH